MPAKSNFIAGQWVQGTGCDLPSTSPADQSIVWEGAAASAQQVDDAMAAARTAGGSWWDTPLAKRLEVAQRFALEVKQQTEQLASLISSETGKPLWECRTEVAAVVGKVDATIEAMRDRADTRSFDLPGSKAVTRYKPQGVCGVLGPFNFPAHLPNGHIVPALILGNTVVFKPSEQTPAVGQWLVEKWQQAGLPSGVLNLVQGNRDVGEAIVRHDELDGLFFTGSSSAGIAIHKALAGQPQKILALEMGGNNPLIVHQTTNLPAAAYLTILSAYLTAGQRCSCARRLILVDGQPADQFVETLVEMLRSVAVGVPTAIPEPFMGTVISAAMGARLLKAQDDLIGKGGAAILPMESDSACPALLTPGLIDVTQVGDLPDEEHFGPLLKIIRVPDFESAIEQANRTAYGLSAALFCDDERLYRQFIHQIRAGVVNWNRQTTGASGKLPFGGCGLSGNHRPGGSFAVDYCSWPVASLESATLALPEKLLPGINP